MCPNCHEEFMLIPLGNKKLLGHYCFSLPTGGGGWLWKPLPQPEQEQEKQ